MKATRRIRAIYTKELKEILRDHRTLIAMVVVPIALYPLLIIGSVNLLSVQEGQRRIDDVRIAVSTAPLGHDGPQPAELIVSLLREAREVNAVNAAGTPAKTVDQRRDSLDHMNVVPLDDVEAAVTSGRCQVGVILSLSTADGEELPQYRIRLSYDKAEIRSEGAADRVNEALTLVRDAWRDRNLHLAGIPRVVVEPLVVEMHNVAAPEKVGGMVLGGIVPLVLILMTITGAIYPAIDLTAGERERGTLETLIVAPVPAVEVVTGKYLVVSTIAMMGATLNLASVGATLYFGDFTRLVSADTETTLPLSVLPVILLCLVPFALLFSAVLVAVCSYARTFKEAQNYIMPVIIAALVPGGIAALPGTQLTGVNTVIPVMNMVLLARELLLGNWDAGRIALVMLSTTLYAGAAVVLAGRVFSMEAVVFADSLSLRAALSRRLIRPTDRVPAALALIVTTILFPVWFFVQAAVQPPPGDTVLYTLTMTARVMPLLFVFLPITLLWYWRVDIVRGLGLAAPSVRHLAAGALIGLSAWIPAHEIFVLQSAVVPVPVEFLKSDDLLREAFAGRSLWLAVLLMALIPGICEEVFFRGFLLGGARSGMARWPAIVLVAAVFALFHVFLIKFLHTAVLGVLLGYLCWQSRSIWPAILAHVLHNGSTVMIAFWSGFSETLELDPKNALAHLPIRVLVGGLALTVVGVWLLRTTPRPKRAVEAVSLP